MTVDEPVGSGGERRVTILGGGLGSMITAWELSSGNWRERYDEIVVHQVGWRLGGKGATSRSENSKRIEEHGLHVWLGFYENSFRLLDEVYRELDGTYGTIHTIEEAFHRSSHLGAEELRSDAWKAWSSFFPTDDRVPWIHNRVPRDVSMRTYLVRTLELSKTMLASLQFQNHRNAYVASPEPPLDLRQQGPAAAPPASPLRFEQLAPAQKAWGDIEESGLFPLSLAAAVARQGIEEIHKLLDNTVSDSSIVGGMLHDVTNVVRDNLIDWVDNDDTSRRASYLLDVTLAIARGIVADGLLTHPDGLDAIDQYDFVEWIMRHGCAEESARCSFIRAVVYDLAFAYVDGDPQRPSGSAATALRGMFRLFFTYSGALMWKMNAGMGEIVFSPMYEALRRRGVRFEFFSRITALELDDSKTRVARIRRQRQVTLRDPESEYQPILYVKGLPCWPEHPDQSQIVEDLRNSERAPYDLESFWTDWPHGTEETIEIGPEDIVVFGISIGSVPHLCSELLDANPAWRTMVTKVRTVQTQALQVWLKPPLSGLGSRAPDATIGGLTEPFDTYSDMTYLLAREDWSSNPPPRTLGYFCNVMEELPEDVPFDETRQRRANEIVERNAISFLNDTVGFVWPHAVKQYPARFNWDLLVPENPADDHLQGVNRLRTQFVRGNVSPSERYVQSVPGSAPFRLHAGGSGFANLVVTGDWIQTGLNCGCVEGAVMSGMLAANAIQPTMPSLDDIIGFHHP
jgi:uncharacterized protein with NAD-binding domain and iron-sulfur cluster